MTLRFSLDTSAVLGAWLRRLPPDVVPSFWARFEELGQAGDVGMIDEAYRELERKSDAVHEWVAERKHLVIEMTPDVLLAAREIVNRFPITRPGSTRSAADPFVIALAQVTRATVVTDEVASEKLHKPRIPDVCRALGVPCTDVYGFVRAMSWKF